MNDLAEFLRQTLGAGSPPADGRVRVKWHGERTPAGAVNLVMTAGPFATVEEATQAREVFEEVILKIPSATLVKRA